jgi:uncharacterized protein
MKLCFPETALAQHLVMLGKTGAGKSSALRHIAENRLEHKKRVCIIDPKGDWWGLKSSADGKSPGYPVIAFGDFKESKATDVPINAHSGKHVAELVATGNRPCIIGFRGWMPAAMTQFWIDFASTLFNSNAGELYLFIDEVHNFAPKGRVMDPAAGKSLHWANRIMSEGRGIGLVCAIASQRPQKVHNDTLTCCETLVAMRVTHAADRQALKDWIDGCGDDTGNELLKEVASLERGEAYIWSPEIGFGPKRVKFPMFTTFDSFAPPQLQAKVSDSGWADVDLGAVKEKMAAVIQEAKANDPRELKTTISKLNGEIAQLIATAKIKAQTQPAPQRVEVPVLDDKSVNLIRAGIGEIGLMRSALAQLDAQTEKLWKEFNDLAGDIAKKHAAPSHQLAAGGARSDTAMPARAPVSRPPIAPVRGSGEGSPEVGSGGLRRMLIAIAQRPGLDNRKLGVRAGMSCRSGTFATYLAKMRTNGWITDRNGGLAITDSGATALGEYQPLPEGDALRQYWLRDLGDSGASRILGAICEVYPNSISQDEVGEKTGMSSRSGTFATYLSKLRALELIEGRGELRASAELFD